MPRGFRKDKAAMLEAFAAGKLKDPRSFISLPKAISGECDELKSHLILYGEADKGPIRAEIFRRNRQENGGVNRCWNCGERVFEVDIVDGITMRGEWHHIRNKAGERCDCPENGRVACRSCHKKRHPRVKFGEAVQV